MGLTGAFSAEKKGTRKAQRLMRRNEVNLFFYSPSPACNGPLWKKSLDGGGGPPPTYPPDPTIQRADVDTPIQSEQNFVSDPDRVMGSSPVSAHFQGLH
jgi:hypothetical protein